MPEQTQKRYCPECGCKTVHEFSEIDFRWYCADPDHREIEQDPDLGGTGHGDISWSDADPGL